MKSNLTTSTSLTCFLRAVIAFAVSMAGGGWVAADCEIGFEEFPSGTEITTQYLSCGVIFAGDGTDPPPSIYDYGSGTIGRILHSHDWYAPMVVSFVEPTNQNQYRPVARIEFDNLSPDGDLVVVTVYDVNGMTLATYASPNPGPETIIFDFGAPVIAFMIVDDISSTAYTVDNLKVFLSTSTIFRDGFETGNPYQWSTTVP